MRSKERLAGKKREAGTKEEMNSQTKERLQVPQEMNRREERPEEYSLMHTAATRGVI